MNRSAFLYTLEYLDGRKKIDYGYHRYDFEKLLAKMSIPISNLELEDVQKNIALLKSL